MVDPGIAPAPNYYNLSAFPLAGTDVSAVGTFGPVLRNAAVGPVNAAASSCLGTAWHRRMQTPGRPAGSIQHECL